MTKPKQAGSGTESGYNGWANYETWNVALWISNDEFLYKMACKYRDMGYRAFADDLMELDNPKDDTIHQIAYETPDNVSWTSADLDIEELDKLLEDL